MPGETSVLLWSEEALNNMKIVAHRMNDFYSRPLTSDWLIL